MAFIDSIDFMPEDELAPVIPPLRDSDRYRKMFDESRQALDVARQKAALGRDYYDDKQLSRKQKALLRKRGQPETIRNRIKPAVNGILGILQQSKVDPRGYPRNPQDQEAADVCSKTLRYIADVNRFHKQKIDAADNHIVEGASAFIIEAEEMPARKAGTAGDKRVVITRVSFDEFFYDPRSREADYKDARYLGVAKWMYSDNVADLYPDYRDDINAAASGVQTSQFGAWDTTWDDKPDNLLPWIDRKSRRIMLVEMYHQEAGKWRRVVFFVGGVLEEGDSPYLDEYGTPICPIEASSCYINRDNERYGVVQSMLFLQDEINARASRALHLTNSRQLQADPNNPPLVDADTARSEAARADGVLPSGYIAVPTSDMAAGNLALLSDAKSEIDRQAPTPAVLGATAGDSSGRSKQVTQQAGMTELARALGRFEDLENRVYRQCWLRAQQYFDAPMWVRVTDEENVVQFLQLNEPVIEGTRMEPMAGPDGQPMIGPDGAPMMREVPNVVAMKNRPADMDMDIEVDTVPDTANLNAETFQALLPLAGQMAAAYGPKATFDVLFKLSPFPNKAEIRDALNDGAEQMQQQQAQAQQAQAQQAQEVGQIAQAKAQAEIGKTNAQAEKDSASARKTQAEIEQMAMQATGAMMPPTGFPPQ